jgi:hypothetical protein
MNIAHNKLKLIGEYYRSINITVGDMICTKLQSLYLVVKDIDGYPGGGDNTVILLSQYDLLYQDHTTTFDENSMEFKRLKDDKFVIINRRKGALSLPLYVIKLI